MRPIILASASPRRQELLKNLGLEFEVQVSDVDENLEENISSGQLVEKLAERKAAAVALIRTQGLVIGADTIVVLGDKPLGKPTNREEAVQMLSNLQGKSHEVFTGLAVIDASTGQRVVTHQVTEVNFKTLTKDQIERYVDTGEPMDKAGGYAVQGLASIFIDSIRGCYFSVVGLPISKLADALRMFGVEIV
ncbi:maf protein [Desulforamulus reducens MI-1]|uniref:dTTP/UTP pyrophosphatase n=1 Tax=Desulforamulus reducens (strain ATCC BAA-1160 / DSM 100696 / MI-1) TaxID=349161 RepID=NTPPA_DESRM|nr:Maf family protein [Desulforamulus reducens]A4J7K7.1 RecName: Full=dTTP/UTP pyrophosphatase; Short=dTTPase/UTPase; AltName: Full=Nucleoside triphosphate pyrophosphatase; AltName: Full=Nucleotide pyrophosphatase; Short=Nucleotide PPase [Desulforamulus reducens MI-1]ABO51060.1 maf protein [Desulforamulus reducens MI-1]